MIDFFKKHKHDETNRWLKVIDKLFIAKQEKIARTKNKGGLPPNKRYHLTPLARHDDFNDAHIKESITKNMTRTFKSNPLPMHRDFVSKQLMGTRIG